MKNLIRLLGLLVLLFLTISCGDDEPELTACEESIETLQINEYQVVGSHNSYRIQPHPAIMAFLYAAGDQLPEGFDPATWDYSHESLTDQFNLYNIRSIELDVYRDPDGGRFYNRMGNAYIGAGVESEEPKLQDPGLKVLHFPDFDYLSHFLTFKDALIAVRSWSDLNPRHLPITVLVEAKEDNPDAMLPGEGLTATLPFSGGAIGEIEAEILNVFGARLTKLIRPDDVRGTYSTLREAVLNNNWPALGDARGRISFVLMAREEVVSDYVEGFPSLEGRSMFVFTDPEKPEAAFLNLNDPVNDFDDIRDYVQSGFIVRTQADSDTWEARIGDVTRRDAAFDSGAQIVCTDFYRPDPRAGTDPEWSGYSVTLPNNQVAVIDPVNSDQTDLDCGITE